MLDENTARKVRDEIINRLMDSTMNAYYWRVLKFNHDVGTNNNHKVIPNPQLEIDMIQEELDELKLAFDMKKVIKINGVKTIVPIETVEEQRVHIADALGDIIYVTMGTAGKHGMDVCKILHEVAKSNETKYDKDGKLQFNENGKIIKGTLFKEPDLSFVAEPIDFDKQMKE